MRLRESIQLEPAFVLHSRPYRDSSLILELLTNNHGRVALVAHGARGAKSRWRPILRPFVELRVSWSSTTELGNLRHAESRFGDTELTGEAVMSGFYLNELILRLLQKHDPHPELFSCYRTAILDLGTQPAPERVLRVFEKRLLEALGYGLTLDRDIVTNEELVADRQYEFRLEQGPIAVRHGGGHLTFSGASLLALAEEALDNPEALNNAKKLLRAALDVYLDGRPLKSRQVMRDMRKRL